MYLFIARERARVLSLHALTRLAAAMLAAGFAANACAQSAAPALKLERSLGANRGTAQNGDAATPIFARANSVRGMFEETTELTGNAEVRRGGIVLRGDRVLHTVATDELQIEGNVRLAGEGTVFTGSRLNYRLEEQTGSMPDVSYSYAPRRARGKAKLMEFLGEGKARLTDATYTTCSPDNEAWWVQADRLDLDQFEQQGVARWAALYFQGVPVFASPYFQFPLSDERRSGVLTPSLGFNTKLGTEVTVPIYWNIAPHRDYTLAPRVMSRRGVLLQNEFRYLEPQHRGRIGFDIIPHDSVESGSREFASVRHEYASPVGSGGIAGGVNYNKVSDDRFFSDFSRTIVGSSQLVLPQEGYLSYSRSLWNAAVRVTKNQTLESLLIGSEVKPYERVPQLGLNAAKLDWAGFDVGLGVDATQFSHPRLEEGRRLIVNPSLAYPWLHPGWFVIPRLQWHYTAYSLDRRLRGNLHSPTRSIPIASLDGGLVFERDTRWFGADVQQTLEPRLFYTYVPYRDQSALPNFDSGLADFNFAQLFSENQFVGGDRIGEANQLTTGLVTRVLDADSGAERLRAAIGQRFYFASQRVTLPGGRVREDRESDLLMALSGRIARDLLVDAAAQHSTLQKQLVRSSLGLRWQPRPASVLSLSYRYKLDELEQYDIAAQWPLALIGLPRWYGVGRANYSKRDRRWVETLAGFEYKADCWVMRFAAQRFTTAAKTSTTTAFFQIELNGLASVGTSPVEQLRRNIPGYQLINPPPREPGRFEFYE